MKNTNPHQIAETVIWEFYGDLKRAEEYCRQILSPAYASAAEIIKAKREVK